MKVIHITDSRKRDTRVNMAHKKRVSDHFYVDSEGHPVSAHRLIRSTLDTDLHTLTREQNLEGLSQQLIDADPEIDMEVFGKRSGTTARIFLTLKNEPASGVVEKERKFSVEGELQEEKLVQLIDANINTDTPLLWSGKLLSKNDCIKKFVFVNAFQLRHTDGLTFDFLFSMAKELEDSRSMLFLGAGKKSNEPLVLSRNGKPFRGFIEGITQGKAYKLILHFSNMELKPLPEPEPEPKPKPQEKKNAPC